MDAAKTAFKKVVQKVADKTTSAGKSKNKEKEEDNEANKIQEIYIPSEKHQQISNELRVF